MFYVDACKRIISFWSICNRYSHILHFMCKVSQKWSQTYKDHAGNQKKSYSDEHVLFISLNPHLSHIFWFGWLTKQRKHGKSKPNFCHNLLKILFIYMFDDKQGIEEEHKPWELKKLSTWLYLIYFKENKIIPLLSQKRSHRIGKKMFSVILTMFSTVG